MNSGRAPTLQQHGFDRCDSTSSAQDLGGSSSPTAFDPADVDEVGVDGGIVEPASIPSHFVLDESDDVGHSDAVDVSSDVPSDKAQAISDLIVERPKSSILWHALLDSSSPGLQKYPFAEVGDKGRRQLEQHFGNLDNLPLRKFIQREIETWNESVAHIRLTECLSTLATRNKGGTEGAKGLRSSHKIHEACYLAKAAQVRDKELSKEHLAQVRQVFVELKETSLERQTKPKTGHQPPKQPPGNTSDNRFAKPFPPHQSGVLTRKRALREPQSNFSTVYVRS